jgi:hypothetical protein
VPLFAAAAMLRQGEREHRGGVRSILVSQDGERVNEPSQRSGVLELLKACVDVDCASMGTAGGVRLSRAGRCPVWGHARAAALAVMHASTADRRHRSQACNGARMSYLKLRQEGKALETPAAGFMAVSWEMGMRRAEQDCGGVHDARP